MRNKDKVKIIVAVIGLIGIVVTAISHAGNDRNSGSNNIKSVNNATNDTNNTNNANNTNNLKVIVQVQGKNVELTEEEAQKMANENENLKDDINRYETEIIKYKSDIQEYEDLIDDDNTQAEFKKLGLTINGRERAIDKEKSSILINGQQYFSQEIVENLLPDNTIITIKDDMIYVGKVVKEKKNLLEQPIIDKILMFSYMIIYQIHMVIFIIRPYVFNIMVTILCLMLIKHIQDLNVLYVCGKGIEMNR